MRSNSKTAAFAAIVLAAVAGAGSVAQAQTVSVAYLGTGAGRNVKATMGATTKDVFSGQLRHTLSNPTPGYSQWSGTFVTFCADFTQTVSSTASTFNIVPVASLAVGAPMGAEKAAAINDLYHAFGTQATAGGASADLAAAFQLVVWEIIGDWTSSTGLSGLSLDGGTFRATQTNGNALTNAVSTHAATMFGALGTNRPTVPLSGIASGTRQDQIVTVPAPGAVALAGMGVLLIAKRRRK